MKSILRSLVLLLILAFTLVLSSCKLEEEKLTPSYSIQTVAAQYYAARSQQMSDRNDQSVNSTIQDEIFHRSLGNNPNEEFSLDLRYNFDSSEFSEEGSGGAIDVMDGMISGFGKFFARLFLGLGGEYDVNVDPFSVTVPPEVNLDLETIRGISLIHVSIESEDTDFDFLENLRLDFLNLGDKDHSPLLASYTKSQRGDVNQLCLKMENINLVPFLKPNNLLNFKPSLRLNSLPPKNMKFKGLIVFRVTLKLPF